MTTVIHHPLVDHRMTYMRDVATQPKLFRELVSEITTFLAYEALRDVKTAEVSVQTPLAKTVGRKVAEDIVLVPILRAGTIGRKVAENVVLVPILRAGMGMLDAMLRVLPYAKVGVLGMQRNEETAEPVPYYAKVPPAKGDELAITIDPMFATGGSAVDAVSQLKKLGYKRIIFLNLVSAPEGIANFEKHHPDVPVYTAAKDERLNSHFYIVPGLGDAGDRIFGTL